MGYEIGARMMSSCDISKKVVPEVEQDLYIEITCTVFLSVR